jgi:hypothetical protein
MKPKFYLLLGIALSILSCKTLRFDQTIPETNAYPDFEINIEKPKSLYALVDTLIDKIYKIRKEGSSIFLSAKERENDFQYCIEHIDVLANNFQIISYYRKEISSYNKKGFIRNYSRKGEKWKRKRKKTSTSSAWIYGSPIPDYSVYDTLFLNIDIIEQNKVSCQLSYWYDTTEIYFETTGTIHYDK